MEVGEELASRERWTRVMDAGKRMAHLRAGKTLHGQSCIMQVKTWIWYRMELRKLLCSCIPTSSPSLSISLRHLHRSVTDEKHEEVQREYLEQDESAETIENKKKEDALRRKLDCFVAPVMMMLMLISYLDRGNIGFAATQGMTTDIGLKGSELNVR